MLELSENDGSIVLSAGSMLVAAEGIKARAGVQNRRKSKRITSTK
jgi:hypothetical protein